MVKFFNKIDSDNTGNYSIKKIGTFYNNDTKKISNFLLRNDFFVDDISAIFCYQPIFGYDSNKFPSKKLVVNQKYNFHVFLYCKGEHEEGDKIILSSDLIACSCTKFKSSNKGLFSDCSQNFCIVSVLS